MAKKTIGLCYFFDNSSNSGIVNYIYNIIAALNSLDDVDKPKLVVFYSQNAPLEYLKIIAYPYIQFILFQKYSSSFMVRKANSLIKWILKIDLYKKIKYFDKVDCLYPYFKFLDPGFNKAKNKVHWLVDFNNRAFPEHYSDDGRFIMNEYQRSITMSRERVVLSSNSLLNELKIYHPNYECDIRILKFASSLPLLNNTSITSLFEKFHIAFPYFMSPNQLWEHKNQGIVLDALLILKNQYPTLPFKVLFTGSLEVNRGKGLYIEKLIKKISDYDLANYVLFLGVLERNEQLLLMKNSVALLQPSLYEGWSTLVEEAKALNKFILLSDIPVHREQISVNVDFFNPHNAEELSRKIYYYIMRNPQVVKIDYHKNIVDFGKSILEALNFL